MSPRRRAHLLLPSPLGTVEYDILEDTAYVGPGPRGGLTANPLPFMKAVALLAASEGGYVVRALPGEAVPVVNDRPGEGRRLADGDRIALAQDVMVYREPASRTPAALRQVAAGPPAERKQPRTRKRVTRVRANPWVTAVSLAGALLLLVGLYLVLDRLAGLRADESTTAYVPDPPTVPELRAARLEPPAQAYRQVAQYESDHGDDLDGSLDRYRDFARKFPGSPEADQARARIRELYDRAGAAALTTLEKQIERRVRDGFFSTALKSVRNFERHYGATPSGENVDALRRSIRARARVSLDALLAKIGPLVGTNPRAAHRALLAASPEYPPDLSAEITGLMERAIELMKSRGGPPPEPRDGPRDGPKPVPVAPGMHPRDTPPPPEAGDGPDDVFVEAGAFKQWREAYAELTAGRYRDALKAYSLLLLRYGDSETVKQHRRRIANGRFAAKVGAEGPSGLLSVPCEEKRGRLEVEYGFDDAAVVQRDFTIEQPFPSDRPVTWKPHQGAIRLAGATGLFHVIVWEPDVRIEARVVAEVAHDFGILAVDDRDEFRAVMFNVNNTLFKLKKGSPAHVNQGHLLWFMGQGVWADSDPEFIGYVKIAERTSVKIQNADRLKMELIRDGDVCEGSFHGRTDGVSLKGRVSGDDGGGLGPARVGVFVNTGIIVVEEIKISGKVNMDWFRAYLAQLVDTTRGPED